MISDSKIHVIFSEIVFIIIINSTHLASACIQSHSNHGQLFIYLQAMDSLWAHVNFVRLWPVDRKLWVC